MSKLRVDKRTSWEIAAPVHKWDFLEDIDQAAPWFGALGDVNLPCWEKLGRDLIEAKGKGELRPGTLPLWRMIRYCLKDGKCVDILREGRRGALSAHQDSMSESDSKEKGNLKEERPKSSKASSKLHTKVEKEKETDQGKTKQKPSGLYPVLDEFADLTLSDSAKDELDSEEEEDLEEAAAAYERERYSPENTEPPPYYPPKAKLPGTLEPPAVRGGMPEPITGFYRTYINLHPHHQYIVLFPHISTSMCNHKHRLHTSNTTPTLVTQADNHNLEDEQYDAVLNFK
ncbi:hypothetical protein STEG23_030277, partial [Scotinomys teguina]